MMNLKKHIRKVSLTVVCLLVATTSLHAQRVTVDAAIDSLQLWIGEQTKMRLEVSCEPQQKVVMPTFSRELVPGLEILDVAKPDTQWLDNRKRMLLTQELLLTSFDSAIYVIPPLEVMVDEKPYHSNRLALYVLTVDVDTLNPKAFFGFKKIMAPEFQWKDWVVPSCYLLLIALIVGLAIYLFKRYRDNKPIIRVIKVEPKLPPHEQAMQEIAQIKEEKSVQKEDAKPYYTALTDTLRYYMHGRYGFNAMEMTSSEILEQLQREPDVQMFNELRELLTTADLVKFSKLQPLMNEREMGLANVVDFIARTKQEPDPNEKQPTEITIEEQRPKWARRLLGTSVLLLAAAAVWLLVLLIRDVYYLCL